MNPYKGIFIIASLFCSATFAGTESSGGGGAVVCRDANKNITFAQLYDIYEANTLSNYGIKSSSTDPNVQLSIALSTLENSNYIWLESVIMHKLPDLINNVKFLPTGVVFAPPEDLGPGVVNPGGCEIEGVGYYDPNGVLNISADIYAAFSNTDRAAFFLHETIYFMDRTLNKATTSAFSRSVNAALFAPNAATNSSIQLLFNQANSALATPSYANSSVPLVVQGNVTSKPTSSPPLQFINIDMTAVLQPREIFGLNVLCLPFWDENGAVWSAHEDSIGNFNDQIDNVYVPYYPGCDVLEIIALPAWDSGASSWQLQVSTGTDTFYSSGSSLAGLWSVAFYLAIPNINVVLPAIPAPPTPATNKLRSIT